MSVLQRIILEGLEPPKEFAQVPTLKQAQEYLGKFRGHGKILDKTGKCIQSCKCRHNNDHVVQVTGDLIIVKDPKYGFEYHKDAP